MLKAWVSEKDREEIGNVRLHLLAYVQGHVLGHGYPPTVREIQEALEFSTTSLVQYHLGRLAKMGLLTKVPGKSRTLRVTDEAKKRVAFTWEDEDAGKAEVATIDCSWVNRQFVGDDPG